MVIGDRLWLFSQNPQAPATPFQSLLLNNSGNVPPSTVPRNFEVQPNFGYNHLTSPKSAMFPNYAINSDAMSSSMQPTSIDNLERVFGNNSYILNDRIATKSTSSSDIDCEEIVDDV